MKHSAVNKGVPRQNAAIILRTNSAAGILSENDGFTQLANFSVKRIDIALTDMIASAAKPK